MVDVGELTAAIGPYLTAVATTYGHAVVARVSDQAGDATADATVGLGRSVLRRLFGSSRAEPVQQAVTELGEAPNDATLAEVLQAQVRAALAADPALAADVARLLADAGVDGAKFTVAVSGGQGVQVGDRNTQTNTFTTPPR